MKKIIAIIAVCLLVSSLQAQRLGVQAGYSLATPFVGMSDKSVTFNTHSGSGFHVGALFDWDFNNRWGLELGALYNLRTMNFDMKYQSDTTTHFNREIYYLDIPVHLVVRFPLKKHRISLFLGPSVNIGLHGKDVAWLNEPNKFPVSLEKTVFGDEKPLGRFDLSGELGVSVECKQVLCRASYEFSVLNTAYKEYYYTFKPQNAPVPYFRQGIFKFSFAYLFDLSK